MNTRLSMRAVTGMLCLSFLLWGCGGGDSTGAIGIGPEGGTVTSKDGRAVVTIPPGALSQATVITVDLRSNPPPGNIGGAYQFGPSGITFKHPVTIKITYEESILPSNTHELDLRLGTTMVNNAWQEIENSTVDPVLKAVQGTTSIFSLYGIIVSAFSGTFNPTTSMVEPRVEHTVSLLPTGKVLIAGGVGSINAYTSAELYDPQKGTFSLTDSMASGRQLHTATLLPNGKVLITGGFDQIGNVPTQGELYDPVEMTFHLTGIMADARFRHTATLLSNGKVLTVGGRGRGPEFRYLASAEIYNPETGTFSVTGSMAEARIGHTATLLPSGKVLIVGGFSLSSLGFGIRLASAEIYDPDSGGFSSTGSMVEPREGHTATLLSNGKVLIAGGVGDVSLSTTAELYNPSSGTFSPTGSMTEAVLSIPPRYYRMARS